MKRLRYITSIFLLLIALIVNYSYAQIQPTLPPSPTAASLGKFIDNPVSHYTGTPNISIPLYEIKLNGLTVPIGLQYNPQDIQVATTPSNVGLGWSLQAGGVITRAVKNVPDDSRRDYCNTTVEYDRSEVGTFLGEFPPYCKWGYLYAISDGVPFVQNGYGYYGTSTYNLDLDAIYANRGTVSPEHAILEQYAYPLWGILDSDGYDFDKELGIYHQVNDRKVTLMKMYTDLEPDNFYFSFPGYSGKFVFDVENGAAKIKTVPYQDLKFTHQTDPATGKLTGFTVTDNKGNVYVFQTVETTQLAENYERSTEYNSAWWLTNITTSNGEVLNFNYTSESVNIQGVTMLPTYDDIYYANLGDLEELNRPFVHLFLNESKRLTSIFNDNIRIDFGATAREDLVPGSTAKSITAITINDLSNGSVKRIKKYSLNYDYFLSIENKNMRYNLNNFDLLHNGNKRLRLKSVEESGSDDSYRMRPYTFEYNYNDYNGNNLKVFPNLYSYNLDLWGYANGASNVTPVPAHHIYPDNFEMGDLRMYSIYEKSVYTGRHTTSVGGNRIPNANYMDIGVLTKINYPTGGSTQYEFEPHKFKTSGEEFIGGGLRIKKIIKNDGKGGLMTYNYRYTKTNTSTETSGKIVSLPLYASLVTGLLIDNAELNSFKEWSGRHSYSISDLGRTSGSNVGYTNVIEYVTNSSGSFDNGRTEFRFSFPAAFGEKNDILNQGCTLNENGICDGLYSSTRIHNFFMYGDDRNQAELQFYPESSLSYLTPPNPNYDWNRGLLLSKKFYNSTNVLVNEEAFQYSNYYPNGGTAPLKVYGIKMAEFWPITHFPNDNGSNSRKYAFRVAKYEVLTDVAKVLSSSTKTIYDDTDPTKSVSTLTEYSYSSTKHMNCTEEKVTNSDGSKLITRYKYPKDYSYNGPAPMDAIARAILTKGSNDVYMNSDPAEVVSLIKKPNGTELVTGAKLTTYFVKDNQYVLPSNDWILELISPVSVSDFTMSYIQSPPGLFIKDTRYKLMNSYKSFDSKNNLLEVLDYKNTSKTYKWGYNKTLPVAEVVNANSSQVAYTSFEETATDNDGWSIQGGVLTSKTSGASNVYSGNYSYKLNTGNPVYGPTNNVSPSVQSGKYKFSCWVKTDEGYGANKGHIKVYTIDNSSTWSAYPSNQPSYTTYISDTKGKWQYFEVIIDLGYIRQLGNVPSGTNLRLRCYVANTSTSKSFYVDELRVYPADAEMTTMTHTPLMGVTSIMDKTGAKVNSFEYDIHNRLRLVKDGSDNIVKSYNYHYKGNYIITSSVTNRENAISPADANIEVVAGNNFVWRVNVGATITINGLQVSSFPYTSPNGTTWNLTEDFIPVYRYLKASNVQGNETFTLTY